MPVAREMKRKWCGKVSQDAVFLMDGSDLRGLLAAIEIIPRITSSVGVGSVDALIVHEDALEPLAKLLHLGVPSLGELDLGRQFFCKGGPLHLCARADNAAGLARLL